MDIMEKLLKLLINIDFSCSVRCNTPFLDCKCHTTSSRLKCSSLKETDYTLETDNGIYKISLMIPHFDFVHIDFVLKNGASENQFISLKDIYKKLNEYPELKTRIRKNKINKINKMIDDILIEKYIKEYKDLLNLLGFKNIYSNSLYRDIFVLNYNNTDYTIIINNDDIDSYSNLDKIESKYFDNTTQSRGGANWRNHPESIVKCITWAKDDFDTLIKSNIRKNKINNII